MCILFLCVGLSDEFKLVLVHNRDEEIGRECKIAHEWDDHEIVGGRDHRGGTWFGYNHKKFRFAAITNVRQYEHQVIQDAPSRGELLTKFLDENHSVEDFILHLEKRKELYIGFNLIFKNLLQKLPTNKTPGSIAHHIQLQHKFIALFIAFTRISSERRS
jgi:uncharacterized protein with NRDE domain